MKDAAAIHGELQRLGKMLFDRRLTSSEVFACTTAMGALLWVLETSDGRLEAASGGPVSGYLEEIAALRAPAPATPAGPQAV